MPHPMLGTPVGADRPARHPSVRNTAAAQRTADVRDRFARRRRAKIQMTGANAEHIAVLAGAVPDPELPMISLANLGVLRAVHVDDAGAIDVTITPTYSGCPATKMMADDIESRLREAGYGQVTVHTVLRDAWSSDDVSEEGRAALLEAGIAPPTHLAAAGAQGTSAEGNPARGTASAGTSAGRKSAAGNPAVPCPLCSSTNTEQLSRFGSTSCKALYRCLDCREPFDYFKVL